RPDADREDVVAAARRAQAGEFIAALPEGYDTLIGERGLTLSGGQRQRLAIARALLADPRILILDDATSSVDASTEQEIKTALREVMEGRTTFVIAHRLSTAATAAALAPPPLATLAIDNGIVPRDVDTLDLVVVGFVVSALVLWGATWLETYLVGWVGQRVLQDLRVEVFSHLQRLSIGFYSRKRAGVLISRLTNDVQALDSLVSDGVVTLFQSSLTLIGTIVILFVLDAQLALLTCLIFPVVLLGGLAFRVASADAYRITR